MIQWCQKCETEPIEFNQFTLPLCPPCSYLDYPQRWVLGSYESPEYFAPRESSYDLMAVFNMLFPPKSDDHIIRSEN